MPKPNTLLPTNPFDRFSKWASRRTGHGFAFLIALGVIVVWAVTGPLFGFSDTWQLVINTGTTIVTFLMVFLIQNTQTRDSEALHIKIDELVRVSKAARTELLDLDELPEPELHAILEENAQIAKAARAKRHKNAGPDAPTTRTRPKASKGGTTQGRLARADRAR